MKALTEKEVLKQSVSFSDLRSHAKKMAGRELTEAEEMRCIQSRGEFPARIIDDFTNEEIRRDYLLTVRHKKTADGWIENL